MSIRTYGNKKVTANEAAKLHLSSWLTAQEEVFQAELMLKNATEKEEDDMYKAFRKQCARVRKMLRIDELQAKIDQR